MTDITVGAVRVSRQEREQELLQRAKVVWMTGLSGSGKTTNAILLERKLFSAGFLCKVIDGDDVREGLNKDLSFSMADRLENIRRVAELSKLFIDAGIIVICSFISPTSATRLLARDIIGADNFVEVYVESPVEVCENRDVKGLYKKARAGQIPDFTGITSPYETPLSPGITLHTSSLDPTETSQLLFAYLYPLISA